MGSLQIIGFERINIPENRKVTVRASLDLKMLEAKFKSYKTKKQLKCKTESNEKKCSSGHFLPLSFWSVCILQWSGHFCELRGIPKLATFVRGAAKFVLAAWCVWLNRT